MSDEVALPTKSAFKSKIVLINIAALAVMVLSATEFQSLIPADYLPIVASVVSLLNVVLRFQKFTNTVVTWSGK
jgi:hypothetical protein